MAIITLTEELFTNIKHLLWPQFFKIFTRSFTSPRYKAVWNCPLMSLRISADREKNYLKKIAYSVFLVLRIGYHCFLENPNWQEPLIISTQVVKYPLIIWAFITTDRQHGAMQQLYESMTTTLVPIPQLGMTINWLGIRYSYQFSSFSSASLNFRWSDRGRRACQSSWCAGRPFRRLDGCPEAELLRRETPNSLCRLKLSQLPGRSEQIKYTYSCFSLNTEIFVTLLIYITLLYSNIRSHHCKNFVKTCHSGRDIYRLI